MRGLIKRTYSRGKANNESQFGMIDHCGSVIPSEKGKIILGPYHFWSLFQEFDVQ